MHRSWHTHGTSDDFRRLIVFIEDPSKDCFMDLALVVYTFADKEHTVMVRPHGNSSSSEQPYIRNLPSTLQRLKTVSGGHSRPAKSVLSSVVTEKGGIRGAATGGVLPRNEKQVYNIRQTQAVKENTDMLYYLMEQSRRSRNSAYVRDVKAVPEPMCVLATDRQLDDLVRFCTLPDQFSIMCVDPTFGIGEFNVTPVVYHHPLVESRRYSSSPIVHGPIFVHQRKEFSTYHYFFSTLISLRPQLSGLQACGSDGEESLIKAMRACFPMAYQLRCFIHVRRNIKHKLNELHLSSSSIEAILGDIFGKSDGATFHEGLVDAASEDELYKRLECLEKKWNGVEEEDTKQPPTFFNWFNDYEAEVVATTMLKSLRESAGLGSPPSEFSTNICESGHASLKKYLPNNCSWPDFIVKSEEFVNDQQQQIELAIVNRGPFKFKEQYSSLSIGEGWFKLNKVQQEAHLKKVFSQTLTDKLMPTADDDGRDSDASLRLMGNSCILSVLIQQFSSRVALSTNTIQCIWEKASCFLKAETSIVPAPGMSDSFYVESKSKRTPHLVQVTARGLISCDKDCEHYRSIKICSHTVAVAEKTGNLQKFVDSYVKKKGTDPPNLGEFSLAGLPSGRNRKGGIPPRKRRTKTPSSLLPRVPSSPLVDLPSSNNGVEVPTSHHPQLQQPTHLDAGGSSFQPQYQVNFGSPHYHQVSNLHQPNYTGSFQVYDGGSYSNSLVPVNPVYDYHAVLRSSPSQSAEQQPTPFVLKLLTKSIKVCSGCRRDYPKKADGSLLDPPFNLCVSHEESITVSPSGSPPFTKKSKVHYHPIPSCIHIKFPSFQPSNLVIPSDVEGHLTQEHWDYLRYHFHVYKS